MTVQSERKTGQSVGLQWVIANVVAWIIGTILINPVANIILGSLAAARIMYFSHELPSSYIYGSMIGGTIYGVLIGALQWLVLHRYLYRFSLAWVLASTLGWALGAGILAYIMMAFWGYTPTSIVRGAILGSIVGILQWIVLRQQYDHTEWWILACIIGGSLRLLTYDLFEVTISPAPVDAIPLILAGFAGAIFGIITGLALMWLLTHPKQQMING